MYKLLRSSLKQTQALRGGHGWHAPPPPIPASYVNKRKFSIFDANCWWYCHVSPEYLIHYYDMHLHDHFGAFKEILHNFCYFAAIFVVSGFCLAFGYNSRVGGHDIDSLEGPFVQEPIKNLSSRRALKKNKLGLSCTGDQSIIFCDYDRKRMFTSLYDIHVNSMQNKKEINIQGANFIKRIEEEAHKKFEPHH